MEFISLPVSVSIVHNNLIASDTMLAFANNIKPNPQIHLIEHETLKNPIVTTQLVKYKNEDEVLHLNYVKVSEKWYLVLGFYNNVQVWKDDGSRMLGYLSKEEIEGYNNDTFFIGSCSYEMEKGIVVGCSKGCISVLLVNEEKAYSFSVSCTLFGRFSEPIAVICSYKFTVLSCNEQGQVSFWDLQQKVEIEVLDQISITATVGVSLKKYGIIGFANGEIRIFNLRDKVLLCSLWGHSRWITGIARHYTRPIFVTCAEDGFINAWAFRSGEVEHINSKEHPNCLLTGVAIMQGVIYSVTYDKNKLNIDNLF